MSRFWQQRRRAPVVDAEEQAAAIAARVGVPCEQVATVLEVEFERMLLQGIAEAPGHRFRYFPPHEHAAVPRSRRLDTEQVALDAQRLAGVPADVARQVLAAEEDDLGGRGLLPG